MRVSSAEGVPLPGLLLLAGLLLGASFTRSAVAGECGTLSFPDPGAEACLENTCCSQAASCSAGTACATYTSCIDSCTTTTCTNACQTQNTSGYSAYQNLRSCLSTCKPGPTCGAVFVGYPVLESCVVNTCCSQTAACFASTACSDIVSCYGSCTGEPQTCLTSCENQYPSGVSAFETFDECFSPCSDQQDSAGGAGGAGGSSSVGTGGSSVGAGGTSSSVSTCGLGSVALQFDGSDAVTIPNSTFGDLTIELWLRTDEAAPGGSAYYDGAGVVFGDVPNVHNDFGTAIVGTSYAFGIGDPDQTLISQGSVVGRGWVHVAAVRQASQGLLQIYIDGALDSSTSVANKASLSDTTSLVLGQGASGFHGDMDELRIWSVARSQADIAATKNMELTGTEKGLVAYYPMHEGKGGVLTDSVGKGSVVLGGPNGQAPAWDFRCDGSPATSTGEGEGGTTSLPQAQPDANAAGGASDPQNVSLFCAASGRGGGGGVPIWLGLSTLLVGAAVRRRSGRR